MLNSADSELTLSLWDFNTGSFIHYEFICYLKQCVMLSVPSSAITCMFMVILVLFRDDWIDISSKNEVPVFEKHCFKFSTYWFFDRCGSWNYRSWSGLLSVAMNGWQWMMPRKEVSQMKHLVDALALLKSPTIKLLSLFDGWTHTLYDVSFLTKKLRFDRVLEL